MAVSVNDLTARIRVERVVSSKDREGFVTQAQQMVGRFWANWLPLAGEDESSNNQFTARERATVTVRYTTKITPECLVYLSGDSVPWAIVGPVSAVNGQRQFTTLKVERKAVTL